MVATLFKCSGCHGPIWLFKEGACYAGGQLCAYVELVTSVGSEQRRALELELRDMCRERLPPAAVPSTVTFLRRLPRSAAGKLQRGALPAPDQAAAATQVLLSRVW